MLQSQEAKRVEIRISVNSDHEGDKMIIQEM